jgi:hypothetical protein
VLVVRESLRRFVLVRLVLVSVRRLLLVFALVGGVRVRQSLARLRRQVDLECVLRRTADPLALLGVDSPRPRLVLARDVPPAVTPSEALLAVVARPLEATRFLELGGLLVVVLLSLQFGQRLLDCLGEPGVEVRERVFGFESVLVQSVDESPRQGGDHVVTLAGDQTERPGGTDPDVDVPLVEQPEQRRQLLASGLRVAHHALDERERTRYLVGFRFHPGRLRLSELGYAGL